MWYKAFKSVFNFSSKFYSLTPVEMPGLNRQDYPTISPILGKRIAVFIVFPRVLALYEM